MQLWKLVRYLTGSIMARSITSYHVKHIPSTTTNYIIVSPPLVLQRSRHQRKLSLVYVPLKIGNLLCFRIVTSSGHVQSWRYQDMQKISIVRALGVGEFVRISQQWMRALLHSDEYPLPSTGQLCGKNNVSLLQGSIYHWRSIDQWRGLPTALLEQRQLPSSKRPGLGWINEFRNAGRKGYEVQLRLHCSNKTICDDVHLVFRILLSFTVFAWTLRCFENDVVVIVPLFWLRLWSVFLFLSWSVEH